MRTIVTAVLVMGCSTASSKQPATSPVPPLAPAHQETPQQGSASASLVQTGDARSEIDEARTDDRPAEIGPDPNRGGTGSASTGSTASNTIGTGHYREIGHGSGSHVFPYTSTGGGGMRSGATPLPNVSLGQPIVTSGGGEINGTPVRRYIKQNLQKIVSCYQDALVDKPTLAGTLTASFTIEENGSVSSSSASGIDPKVEGCVAQTIRKIEFPRQKYTAQTADVVYRFTFRPAGS